MTKKAGKRTHQKLRYNKVMETTNQVTTPPNPTGKGGFGDHPENRNPGGWKKEDSYSYQLNLMDRMTVKEFKEWLNNHPEDERTMAQEKAYNAQLKSRKELAWLKEVTDRTEGKAQQHIDMTSKGEQIGATIVFEDKPEE